MSERLELVDCDRRRLDLDTDMSGFDCDCPDLNDFIHNDALNYTNELLAATFVYFHKGVPVAFVSYSNDKISAAGETLWNRISRSISNRKRSHAAGYPAVKIGRLGIDKNFKRLKLGSQILDFTKAWFITNNKTGCRFITLDAYNQDPVVSFYKSNGFDFLEKKQDPPKRTVLMHYDLRNIL